MDVGSTTFGLSGLFLCYNKSSVDPVVVYYITAYYSSSSKFSISQNCSSHRALQDTPEFILVP